MAGESKRFPLDGTDQTHSFTYVCTCYAVWANVDMQVEEDEAIDADTFTVPANTLYNPAIGVKDLHLKGTAGGLAWIKGIYHIIGVADREAELNLGGLRRS